MAEEKKEIKVSKSYSLRPSQIAWLRQRAQQASTPDKDVSASAVLEEIIDQAIIAFQSPTPSQSKKNAARLEVAVAA